MYKKVSSDLNFVDREKQTVEFWKEHKIFERVSKREKGMTPILFMTGLRQQTENPISAMF